jgi:glucosamine 6-phosphate synthetase-like amidotransferase/phosphosugar isomerase protein
VYTQAGPEISVASTKAYVTQLTALYHPVGCTCILWKAAGQGRLREYVRDLTALRTP